MKRLTVSDPASCTACYSCEVACSETYHKRYDRDLSCIRITGYGGKINVNVCSQCGACIEVCPLGALSRRKNGVVAVDSKLCDGCMACADVCPNDVVCRLYGTCGVGKCTACGKCAAACPVQILTVTEE